jgi:hypothetical protein
VNPFFDHENLNRTITFTAGVSDAPPVKLAGKRRGREASIDPRRIQIQWLQAADQESLLIQVFGKIYRVNGEVGEQRDTRGWHIEPDTPKIDDLPDWVTDKVEELLADPTMPDWAEALWSPQHPRPDVPADFTQRTGISAETYARYVEQATRQLPQGDES